MYGFVVFLLLDLLLDLDILQQGVIYIGLELSTVQKWVDAVSGILFYIMLQYGIQGAYIVPASGVGKQ